MNNKPPEKDKAVWIAGLAMLTLPAAIWGHWALAAAGAVCWLWLFLTVRSRKGE